MAWLVDFGSLTNSGLVLRKVAEAVGLDVIDTALSANRIASLVSSRELLFLFDNCEHVIDDVTKLTESIMLAAPRVGIIATSREPLGARGEAVYRLDALSVPGEDCHGTTELLSHSAIELFLARVHALDATLEFGELELFEIGAICRRLDGLPLAIELAASRATAIGISELAARLDDQFKLITGGFRNALPRHRTLAATFDWSYGLLDQAEPAALGGLSIFVGPFTLAAATKVIAGEGIVTSVAVDRITSLVAKSLVITTNERGKIRYRLLETTRAYAFEKLKESDQFEIVARRHAQFCLEMLGSTEIDWKGSAKQGTLPTTETSVANVERALGWASSSMHDSALAVKLAVAAVPLFLHLSMTKECRQYVDRALAIAVTNRKIDMRQEMELYAALGVTLVSATASGREVRAAFSRALAIAEQINDAPYRLQALWGLCNATFNDGDYQAALDIARRLCAFAAASGDPSALRSGELLLGISLFLTGKPVEAERHLTRLLVSEHPGGEPSSSRFLWDRRVVALGVLSAVLWHRGFPDQAEQRASEGLEEAFSKSHALSVCIALGNGCCFVALQRGDFVAADRFLTMLVDYSNKLELDYWRIWAECLRGVLLTRTGRAEEGARLLQSGFQQHGDKPLDGRFLYLRGHLAEALGIAGNPQDGLPIVEEAIAASRRGQQVILPILLRIKGELQRLLATPDAFRQSEALFRQAIDLARAQRTRAAELQAAISLVLLCRARGEPDDAIGILSGVYAGFTEGFATADLTLASRLLREHRQGA